MYGKGETKKGGKQMEQRIIKGFIFNRKAIVAARKRAKQKQLFSRIFRISMVVLTVSIGLEAFKFLGLLNMFDTTILGSGNIPEHMLGVLVLGVDADGVKNVEAGHTDSITYIGANTQTKQAYALPIYRDTNVALACNGEADNINRIYAQKGIKCLADSTSAFLGLPVNKYIVMSMEGFIDIIGALGTIELTPAQSFCSRYGIDEDTTYCFTAGVTKRVGADEAMAYARYRGASNGEARANHQIDIIKAVKNACLGDAIGCYNKVSSHLAKAIKTNFSADEITALMQIFGADFELHSLEVIKGRNTHLGDGNWTMYVDEEDKEEKVARIREEIFT